MGPHRTFMRRQVAAFLFSFLHFMKLLLLHCLAFVLRLLLRLTPARAQALAGTFAAGDVHSLRLSIYADGTL
jgi:hypothetical protein